MKKSLSKRNRRVQLGLGVLIILVGLLMGLSVPRSVWLEVKFSGDNASFQLHTTPGWSVLGRVRFLTSEDGQIWQQRTQDGTGWDGWQGEVAVGDAAVLHVKAVLTDVLGQHHETTNTFVTTVAKAYAPLDDVIEALANSLIQADPNQRVQLVGLIKNTKDKRFLPYLVELYRFWNTPPLQAALESLSGQRFLGTQALRRWYEWLWAQPFTFDESFFDWKRALLAHEIPAMKPLLHAQGTLDWTHVVWGGVPPGGIRPLNGPAVTTPTAASYLKDDDIVFGALVNGQARAYPLRILDWHEMVNDVLGGVPVVLSYCPLCGSALLFERQLGDTVYEFNTSGLLLDSNKLMFDEQTKSLWPNLTGEPVAGPLAGGAGLKRLSLTISSWAVWRTRHPDGDVVAAGNDGLLTYEGHEAYDLYRVSDETLAPVSRVDERLAAKDWVFGLVVEGRAVAFAVSDLQRAQVWNTSIGPQNVVLVAEAVPGSQHGFLPAAVRAFLRGTRTFTQGNDALVDQNGVRWTVCEEGLCSDQQGVLLPRLLGETGYWFAWSTFHPDTELRDLNQGR